MFISSCKEGICDIKGKYYILLFFPNRLFANRLFANRLFPNFLWGINIDGVERMTTNSTKRTSTSLLEPRTERLTRERVIATVAHMILSSCWDRFQ
jgi:hypothetical protein